MKIKNIYKSLILFSIFFISCSQSNLEVKTLEEVPSAVVRIEVSSTQAELDENLNINLVEYEGSGSGFFLNSDGYIITNNHVVSGAVTIDVYTNDSDIPYTAYIVGQSECDDIAVIKIDKTETSYFQFSSDNPQLGEEILAVGFPRGDEEVTFLDGIISKRETNGSTTWASFRKAFEHTAEILPGSSGGPVLNSEVQVIGIAYAGNEDRQEFGIPIVEVNEVIESIIDSNFIYTLNAHIEQVPGVGIYVYSTELNSPLREVGIKGGEVINKIGGKSIQNEETLEAYCSYLKSRTLTNGIRLSGVSLNTLEDFDVETSLGTTLDSGPIENDDTSDWTFVAGESPQTTFTPATTTTTLPPEPVANICVMGDTTSVWQGEYWNTLTLEGLDKATNELNIEYTFNSFDDPNDSNYREKLVTDCIDAESDLIVGVGFLYQNVLYTYAEKYPEMNFGIIDSVIDLPNTAGIVFREHEGSFLVGVAAGLKTTTKKVGYIGGVEFPLIQKFEAGFTAGVLAVCSECEVDVKYVTYPPDFSGFNDTAKAKEIALAQYEEGADIIYHAAGGSSLGIIEATKEFSDKNKKVGFIGVDTDQYLEFESKFQPYVLTSMIKRVDQGIYLLIKSFIENNFQIKNQEVVYYGINENAVDYSISGGFIDKYISEIEYWKRKVRSGEFTVPEKP